MEGFLFGMWKWDFDHKGTSNSFVLLPPRFTFVGFLSCSTTFDIFSRFLVECQQ